MKPEANNLSLFKFKNSDIRVVQIDGEPWFVAADACDVLGLRPAPSNGSYQNHYRRLAADELTLSVVPHPNGQNIRMKLMTESGLYKLVMRSDKPEAKEFQNWVTKVILPAIRKDGGYIHGEEHVVSGAMTEDELVFKAMEVMKRKVDRLSAENAKMEAVINEHLKFMTVGEFREHHHRYWTPSTTTKVSNVAKGRCREMGWEVTKQNRRLTLDSGREIDTEVNVYPVEALDWAAEALGVLA